MNLSDIKDIVARSVELGYLQALKAIEPAADTLRQSEVRKWLRTQNIKPSKFDAMVAEGLVRSYRRGSAANSPLYYSKKEIKQALLIGRVEEITSNN